MFFIVQFKGTDEAEKKHISAPITSFNEPFTTKKIIWDTKEPIFASDKPDSVVRAIYDAINPTSEISFSGPSDATLWWITGDGWNTLDRSAVGFTIFISFNTLCERAVCIRHPTIQEVNRVIPPIFLQNSFTQNKLNSSSSEDDETLYDYILAFEKDDTKCTLITNPEITSHGTDFNNAGIRIMLACSENINQRYREQLPFLKALYAGRGQVGYEVVDIRKTVGDFALLGLGARRTGATGVFKKIDGSWQLLYVTQEQPLCSIIVKYDIPVEIYGSTESQHIPSTACFDKSGRMLASPNGPPL